MTKPISYMVLFNTISELLTDGYPTIEQTVDRLGVSVPSLQRSLHELGFTYSEVVEDIRLGQACLLLRNPDISVGKAAALLAYKDSSSFSRAFGRWMNVPPQAYRRRYQEKVHRSRQQHKTDDA